MSNEITYIKYKNGVQAKMLNSRITVFRHKDQTVKDDSVSLHMKRLQDSGVKIESVVPAYMEGRVSHVSMRLTRKSATALVHLLTEYLTEDSVTWVHPGAEINGDWAEAVEQVNIKYKNLDEEE